MEELDDYDDDDNGDDDDDDNDDGEEAKGRVFCGGKNGKMAARHDEMPIALQAKSLAPERELF